MRSKNAILNFITGIFGQIIILLLGFVSRALFLMILSVEYLGVSSLFSSILTMLSFAELGVGTAIVYSLYKPLAENNEEEILALMNLFKKVYRIIGLVVFIAGMICLPFLDVFVPDRHGIENLEIIFVLYIIQTASSYFFSYNRSLITADQKAYRLTGIDYTYKVLHVIIPIAILAISRSFIIYLCSQIVITIISNIIIFFRVKYLYPVLKSKNKPVLSEETKKAILKNTSALLIYKIAIVVTAGTDNILLSHFFGLTIVGLCANYTLIVQNLTSLVSQGINAVTASIGNLASTEDNDKKYQIFNVLCFINFWIYGFASIGLYFCSSPLVAVIFGEQYTVSDGIVLAMTVSFFVLGMQGATSVFRDAQGLFWYGKLRPLAQTIVNLGVSILLAVLTGEPATIFWGTVISRLTTSFWYDPLVVHKYGFQKSVKKYFLRYGIYVLASLVAFAVCFAIFRFIHINQILIDLIVKIVICTVVTNGLFLILFIRSSEFIYLKNSLKTLLKRKRKKE